MYYRCSLFILVRREGREKWNQQQKRMKRLAQANNEAAKKRKMKE